MEPGGSGPVWCPTLHGAEIVKKALAEYRDDSVRELARLSTVQEGECYLGRSAGDGSAPYPVKPRAVEVVELAGKMGWRRIGIAFCTGLFREAGLFSRIVEESGLEAVSVACKAGRTPKEDLGIRDDQKIRIGRFEAMCSPVAQAMILDHFRTDLNVAMGLCVGHDSLFFRYSRAPVTVLVAKDRVTGHNPSAVLYNLHSYYRNLTRRPF
jgi:uncharacterized metal-binding protein